MTPLAFRWLHHLVSPRHPVRDLMLAFTYAALFFLSIWFAYQLRFDFHVPPEYAEPFLRIAFTTILIKLIWMSVFHQFNDILNYFGYSDLKRVLYACGCSALVLFLLWILLGMHFAPPRAVILADLLLSVVALVFLRFVFRMAMCVETSARSGEGAARRRVGIVGAGEVGSALANDLVNKPWLGLLPVAFFDDRFHRRCRLHGIQVVGGPDALPALKSELQLEEVLIAMPSANPKRLREVAQLVRDAGLPCRTVPSLDQLATGCVSVTALRPVDIHDLLGRPPVHIESMAVSEILRGRTVMITGAGGSIGAELCRQVLTFAPGHLLLVDRSEPSLFLIQAELQALGRGASVVPLIGDVTRLDRMHEVFERYKPDVVFHAAAHKHVPMMENQPEEAIRNNILGTTLLADMAIHYGVDRFVLISTDKAVNPTSVMGATKRFAELVIQSLNATSSGTKFQAVRFGNVLGSSGSVVPIFSRQIAEGGPVTVTHRDVVRYFMTIPEAVSLVLQSATLGQGGEVFVLDMGNPVRIADLAEQMIKLSGLRPGEDIEIVYTGLRPGEKLYEEVSHRREDVLATKHPKVMRHTAAPLEHAEVRAALEELIAAVDEGRSAEELKRCLARTIPEYTPFLGLDEKSSAELLESGRLATAIADLRRSLEEVARLIDDAAPAEGLKRLLALALPELTERKAKESASRHDRPQATGGLAGHSPIGATTSQAHIVG